MWFRDKKPKEPKVVLNKKHIWRELMPIPKRPLSAEEIGWVRESLGSRKELLDFSVPQLFAISKCPCGTCRTLGLEPIALPELDGRSGHIGGITINTKEHGPIDILLHAKNGYLAELEVIWYFFPKPFPDKWEEVSRTIAPPH